MKRTTVILTDEQAKRLDSARRQLGVAASELVRRALDAYLDVEEPSENGREMDSSNALEPQGGSLWFVGLGRSSRYETATNAGHVLDDEYLRYIWEDSFGGTRSAGELHARPRGHEHGADDEAQVSRQVR